MSKTWKTPKGTELPILGLKGKDYLQVAFRVVWFREEYPTVPITTEIIHHDADSSVVKATIGEGKDVMATSHKSETRQGFADHLEKAETGAIGRALALCGFGTQFCADELDEGNRLADSPLPPSKPAMAPTGGQKPLQKDESLTTLAVERVAFGKFIGKTFSEIPLTEMNNYIDWIHSSAKKQNRKISLEAEHLVKRWAIYQEACAPAGDFRH